MPIDRTHIYIYRLLASVHEFECVHEYKFACEKLKKRIVVVTNLASG
jgi:hypothetical protein